MGTKPRSSERTARALNHGSIAQPLDRFINTKSSKQLCEWKTKSYMEPQQERNKYTGKETSVKIIDDAFLIKPLSHCFREKALEGLERLQR